MGAQRNLQNPDIRKTSSKKEPFGKTTVAQGLISALEHGPMRVSVGESSHFFACANRGEVVEVSELGEAFEALERGVFYRFTKTSGEKTTGHAWMLLCSRNAEDLSKSLGNILPEFDDSFAREEIAVQCAFRAVLLSRFDHGETD